MGAWGTGIFEDDTSLDALADLIQEGHPFSALEAALQGALGSEDEVDYTDGLTALVAAALIDHKLYGTPMDEEEDGMFEWLEGLTQEQARALAESAANAAEAVIGPSSEIAELWEEAGEESFSEWRTPIEAMVARLRMDLAA